MDAWLPDIRTPSEEHALNPSLRLSSKFQPVPEDTIFIESFFIFHIFGPDLVLITYKAWGL